jgi:hypothetical protein
MARISFESYKKKLRAFAQYKNMSDEFFENKAKTLYDKKFGAYQPKMEIIDNEVGSWLSQDEADKAQELYNGYLKGRNITNFSDLVLLKTLVNYDIQSMRIQRIINDHLKKSNDDAKGVFVPTKELNMLNEINEQILSLKKTLGLSDEKKTNDPLEYVNALKRKMFAWAKEQYALSRFRKCPHCSQPLVLLMRPEVWDAYKHPFFVKDKYLFNEHLWDMYKSGKINALDVAKVLLGKEVEVDYYTQWLDKRVNSQENKDPLLESGEQKKESDS